MRDGLGTIARAITRIVGTKKMLRGTRVDLLMELRDKGALGELDRGIKRERRDTPRANLQKFQLLEEALWHAVQAGKILATTEEDGTLLLAAPHVKPDVVVVPESQTAILPDPLPFTAAQLVKLRAWDELVSV